MAGQHSKESRLRLSGVSNSSHGILEFCNSSHRQTWSKLKRALTQFCGQTISEKKLPL